MSEQTQTPQAEIEQAEVIDATAIEQALAAGRKPKNKLGNCECASWEIGQTTDRGEGEEPDVTIIVTGCDKVTKRMFAQGHDAKLKSLFIRAGVEGLEVRYGRAAGVLVTTDYEGAAKMFGFERQVIEGVRNRLDKLARSKQAIPPAPRTAPVEVVEGSQEGDENIARGWRGAAEAAARDGVDAPVIPQAPADQDGWTEEAMAEVVGTDEDPGDEVIASGVETVKGKVGRWEYEGTVAADGSFHYNGANGEPKVADAGKWSPVA
jgi:hypothetical protein